MIVFALKVMELAIAEPFVAPVDLNVYPTYAYTVEYPIDLSTIKVLHLNIRAAFIFFFLLNLFMNFRFKISGSF